jgi:hypothetical protein
MNRRFIYMRKIAVFVLLMSALAGLSALQAADWSFTLSSGAKAGTIALEPGEYKLALRGSVAVITDVKTSKSFTVVVKTENSDRKFDVTQVATAKRDGENRVLSVAVGGSPTKVLFE